MSVSTLDETLLNDNDDDLNVDFEIDPVEESALLDEEDEDILDLSYDQMESTNEILETSFSSSKEELKDEVLIKNISLEEPEKNRTIITKPDNFKKNVRNQRYPPMRGGRRRAQGGGTMRRGNTLLIKTKFRGPVQVTSKVAWNTPPSSMIESQEPQQYVQPWINGVVPNQAIAPPQIPYNAPFNTYMPPYPHQELNLPFVAPHQIFVNQSHPAVQHSIMMNRQVFSDQYQNQANTQVPFMQQPPIPQKLPVHQRLGVPTHNTQQQPNILNQPCQNSFQYGNFQNVPNNNQFAMENRNFNQFSSTNELSNSEHIHMNNVYMNNNQVAYNSTDVRRVEFPRNQVNKFDSKRRKDTFYQNRNLNQIEMKEEKPAETTVKIIIPEDEDEETRQYRLMIEEQKRKRQEVLRRKEENRLKNLGLQNEETKSAVHSIEKLTFVSPQKKTNNFKRTPSNNHVKMGNNIVITGIDNESRYCPRQNVRKLTHNLNNRDPTRIVLSGNQPTQIANTQLPASSDIDSKGVSSFLSNRAVVAQDDLMKTNIVVVKNLSTTTTEKRIMNLCQEVGQVQKLQMEKKEHRAFIHFNTVPSAHAFYKKFRRYMIDLSMVQVDLVPCEDNNC